jgi:hypothetical protein
MQPLTAHRGVKLISTCRFESVCPLLCPHTPRNFCCVPNTFDDAEAGRQACFTFTRVLPVVGRRAYVLTRMLLLAICSC